jgi:hypothetical protein
MSHLETQRSSRPTESRDVERGRRLFLFARAQVAAGRPDTLRREAERRRWEPHRRRFS